MTIEDGQKIIEGQWNWPDSWPSGPIINGQLVTQASDPVIIGDGQASYYWTQLTDN